MFAAPDPLTFFTANYPRRSAISRYKGRLDRQIRALDRTLVRAVREFEAAQSARPRVLASIGHPLVGDPLYGPTGHPLENLPGLPGDGGYLLHAQFLNFPHPITGEPIHLEAAIPSGFPPPR